MWEKEVKSGPGGGGNRPKASGAHVKIILDLSKHQKGSSKPLCGSVRRVYARAREAFTQKPCLHKLAYLEKTPVYFRSGDCADAAAASAANSLKLMMPVI